MRKKNIIILDNIRSLNNIGSIFRTCDGFHIEKLILCGICGTPPNREINKTALGATNFVEWEYYEKTSDVIRKLRELNYTIISIEQTTKSITLTDYQPKKYEKLALIFGNEVKGVSSNVITNSDYCIEIPQYGEKKSMNVSICVGIILWDLLLKQS